MCSQPATAAGAAACIALLAVLRCWRGVCAAAMMMMQELAGLISCGVGFAYLVGGRPELGAAVGAVVCSIVAWLRLPPAVRVPPVGSGVVVSGASSGIGRAAAERLAKMGYVVFAGVRKMADGDPLKAAGCVPVLLDVQSEESVAAAAEEVRRVLGSKHLAAIVNNAGVSGSSLPTELETEQNLQFVFNVNVFGILRMNRHFLPLLREFGRGARVVNIGSVMGFLQVPSSGTYCMSKHAVEALTGCSRAEVARWGISVSVLNPGYVRTGSKYNVCPELPVF